MHLRFSKFPKFNKRGGSNKRGGAGTELMKNSRGALEKIFERKLKMMLSLHEYKQYLALRRKIFCYFRLEIGHCVKIKKK